MQYSEGGQNSERRAIAYTQAWRSVLPWKRQYQTEARNSFGQQKVTALSLLPPSPKALADYEQAKARGENVRLETSRAEYISQKTAQYLSDSVLAQYTPGNIQVILYPEDKDLELFPDKNRGRSFAFLRGGYPAIFMPLTLEEDGMYALNPYYLGRSMGEIVYSHMIHRTGMKGSIPNNHFLQKGLAEVIGLDIYKYFMQKEGENLRFDSSFEENYRRFDLRHILSEVGFASLSERQQGFMKHILAGSLITSLIDNYGFQKVVEFFDHDAHARVEEHTDHLRRVAELAAFGVSVNSFTERVANPPKNRLELIALLKELGYETTEYFVDISTSSTPPDDRPEGAIASAIVDQYDRWFNPHQTQATQMDEPIDQVERRQKTHTRNPSFVEKIIDSLNAYQAKAAFGEKFSAESFVNAWRRRMIDTYS